MAFQRWIVADVEAVKMNMIGARILAPSFRPEHTPQVRLARLVAAAGRAATELDAVRSQRGHDALAQCRVAFLQDQRESVVAAAFEGEIGLVRPRIEVVKK